MADNRHLYGFRWAGFYNGTPGPQPLIEKFIATGYDAGGGTNVNINVGDPLVKVNDGSVALASAGGTYPIDYICAGVVRYWDGTKMTFGNKWPHGTVWTTQERQARILVTPITAGNWECDCDAADYGSALGTEGEYQVIIGENIDMVYSNDATAMLANPLLDISTHATTSTLQLRIVDVSKTFANADFTGNYVKLIVKANVTNLNPWTAAGQTGV